MQWRGAIPIKVAPLLVRGNRVAAFDVRSSQWPARARREAGRFRPKAQSGGRVKDKGATMNDIACQLRAQIASSTDPDRLERLAREAEAPTVQPHHSASTSGLVDSGTGGPSRPPLDISASEGVIYITFFRKAQ